MADGVLITRWFAVIVFVVCLAFDVWVIQVHGQRASISVVLFEWSRQAPVVAVIAGGILFHIFWPHSPDRSFLVPHDSKGQVIARGDLVIFRATVGDVFASESACNANFALTIPAGVPETYGPIISCNSRLCEKVGAPAPAHPELHARITTAALPAPIKDGLVQVLEQGGPLVLNIVVGMLEKAHPEYTVALEAVKTAILAVIPQPAA